VDGLSVSTLEVPKEALIFTGTLQPFQRTGVQKLLQRGGGLLSYLYGLGKTPVALAWAEDLMECGQAEMGWVVCEPSLKYQWVGRDDPGKPQGIRGFTDSTVLVIDGDRDERVRQYAEAATGKYNYVIIGYRQIVDDWEIVKDLPRDFIIADEVTAIKNPHSQRSRKFYTAKQAPRLYAPYRLGLSGAPIENKIEDAYFIMRWIDPDVFGPPQVFETVFIERDRFGRVQSCKDPRLFRELLDTAMVRHDKEDVKDNLPEVTGGGMISRWISLDPPTADLYEYVVEMLLDDLEEAKRVLGASFNIWAHYGGHKDPRADAIRGKLMGKILALRLLCDDPRLLHVSAKKYKSTDGKTGSAFAAALQDEGELLDINVSGAKAKALDKRVNEILSEDKDNKVVLFTSFREMLNLVEPVIKPYGHVVYHGGMNAKHKEEQKQKFLTSPHTRVFLSSDAGGYGLDLPAASYLINIDLPWGAGKQGQRNARIVRMSSKYDEVTQEALLIDGSIEERMLDIILTQTKMAASLLDGDGPKRGSLDVSVSSLSTFLQESRVR